MHETIDDAIDSAVVFAVDEVVEEGGGTANVVSGEVAEADGEGEKPGSDVLPDGLVGRGVLQHEGFDGGTLVVMEKVLMTAFAIVVLGKGCELVGAVVDDLVTFVHALTNSVNEPLLPATSASPVPHAMS